MPDCSSLQKSLAWCQGRPELPGVKRRIYYISKYDILKWPTLPHDANGRLIGSAYQGDFTLRADATWKYIDIIPDKSQLTSEAQGEYPSQTQLNKLVAVHPSVGADATAAAAYLNNNDNAFLVEDMHGAYRVVGSDKWQTKTTVTQDLGQGAAGSASTTINVEASDECPAPFYAGKIATEDGIINPEGNPNQATGDNNSGGSNARESGEFHDDITDDDNGNGSGQVNTGDNGGSSNGDNTGGNTSGNTGDNTSTAATFGSTVNINGTDYNLRSNKQVQIKGPLTSVVIKGSNINLIALKHGKTSEANVVVSADKTTASWTGNYAAGSMKVYHTSADATNPQEELLFTITVYQNNDSGNSGTGSESGSSSESGSNTSSGSGSDEIAYSGKNGVSYNKGVIVNGTKYSVEKGGNIKFNGILKSITVTGVNVKDIRLKYTENGAEKYQQFTVDESNTSAKWTGNLNPTQTVTVRVDDGSQFQLITLCTIDIQE